MQDVPICKTPLMFNGISRIADADGNILIGHSLQSRPRSMGEIVRRVNLHDELVEALTFARAVMDGGKVITHAQIDAIDAILAKVDAKMEAR